MAKQHSTFAFNSRRSRRRGSLLIFVALGLTAFIGVAALSVDMGSLYGRRAKAQRAADAAALAGAYQLATFAADPTNPNPAHVAARDYARRNGYDSTQPGVTVNTIYPVPGDTVNRYRVQVQRIEPTFFAHILGVATKPVGASATAEYSTEAPLSINGGGTYGQPNGPTSLSMFGPDGRHDYGDFRSPRLLMNGTPNPDYNGQGYDFIVNVPTNYTATTLEIFDPDCYNAGGVADAQNGVRIDELRRPWPTGGSGTLADATTSTYTLYWDPSGRGDRSQFQVIGSPYTVGADPSTDMKWVTPFTFDRSLYPSGRFILNAVTISGSSENGFSLRAGPPRAPGVAFDPNNGTSISAEGHVPINFNGSGTTQLELGTVPVEAAGKQLTIRKFDTDIQSQSVTYTCDSLPGQTFTGILAGNDQFVTDKINLPTDYTGGTWFATYAAGNQDTSVWEMSYSGAGPGRPGPIRLVR